jgi:inosose dehydratase
VFDKKPTFTNDEWKRLAEGLNKLGERAQEKGMALTYHHHMGTGVQTSAEIDRLMEATQTGLLDLLYDTGHLVFSGEDHLAVLKKWGKRIKHVHLKDVRPAVVAKVRKDKLSFLDAVKAGAFTVPGDGSVDFVPVFQELDAIGYKGWWVVEAEQDPALANPLEYALKARKYIREKAGI